MEGDVLREDVGPVSAKSSCTARAHISGALGSHKRVAGMGGWEWREVVAWMISVGKRNWMGQWDRVRK